MGKKKDDGESAAKSMSAADARKLLAETCDGDHSKQSDAEVVSTLASYGIAVEIAD